MTLRGEKRLACLRRVSPLGIRGLLQLLFNFGFADFCELRTTPKKWKVGMQTPGASYGITEQIHGALAKNYIPLHLFKQPVLTAAIIGKFDSMIFGAVSIL